MQNIKLELTDTLEPGDLANEGPSDKSPPEQSPQESMKPRFSSCWRNTLTQSRMARRPTILFLVLDPDTLGEVRPLLHKEVTDRVILELPKTLANSPSEDIEKSLAAA